MPPEDTYRVKGNTFCVADGITRDPLGITDFSGHSMEEILYHPRPGVVMFAIALGFLGGKLGKENDSNNLERRGRREDFV